MTSQISERPLSARSIVLSILLGNVPPRLPVRRLVIAGDLFGVSEGAVRTAVTRMAERGEIQAEGDGWYRLGSDLVARQERQRESREAATREWNGEWAMAVVGTEPRAAGDRAGLRAAMGRLRFAERRDGVWLRPDNLPEDRLPADRQRAAAQCDFYSSRPLADPADLAAQLWDLDTWNRRAEDLRAEMPPLCAALVGKPTREALASGFTLAASVLRHFQADPLLPPILWGADSAGEALRADFDRLDSIYRTALGQWFTVHDSRPRD